VHHARTRPINQGNGITGVRFANYGAPAGDCPPTTDPLHPGTCGANLTSIVAAACVGKANCTVRCTHGSVPGWDACCGKSGIGGCCGCNATAPGHPPVHFDLPDPCPNQPKTIAVSVRCADQGAGGNTPIAVVGLKVNAMEAPISIDDPMPYFSWILQAEQRAVAMVS
jgi:hypothetical protein